MHVEQTTGAPPGIVFATIRHGNTVRTLSVEILRTTCGHFVARMPDKRWSLECRTLETAILMHAAVIFPVEIASAPWLDNPRPVCPAIHQGGFIRPTQTAQNHTPESCLAEKTA